MENLLSNIQQKLTGNSFKTSPNEPNNFRKIQMPQAKIGLGSTEADLISMIKTYLEIVGLVVFVWIFGKKYFYILISQELITLFVCFFFFFIRLFSFQYFMDFTCCIYIFISSTKTNTI